MVVAWYRERSWRARPVAGRRRSGPPRVFSRQGAVAERVARAVQAIGEPQRDQTEASSATPSTMVVARADDRTSCTKMMIAPATPTSALRAEDDRSSAHLRQRRYGRERIGTAASRAFGERLRTAPACPRSRTAAGTGAGDRVGEVDEQRQHARRQQRVPQQHTGALPPEQHQADRHDEREARQKYLVNVRQSWKRAPSAPPAPRRWADSNAMIWYAWLRTGLAADHRAAHEEVEQEAEDREPEPAMPVAPPSGARRGSGSATCGPPACPDDGWFGAMSRLRFPT
jgi:hypothetical protein